MFKLIGALTAQHAKKREQLGYLKYSLLQIKIHFISPEFWHFSLFWGSKWSRSNPMSHKTIWHIPNIKNSEFQLKNARFFQTPFYFSFIFLDNTSHKFWDQSHSPHYQNCLQVSETVTWHKLRCCYSANTLQHGVEGKGLIYFCKVGHSRISRKFSRNWLGLNNLCEIL